MVRSPLRERYLALPQSINTGSGVQPAYLICTGRSVPGRKVSKELRLVQGRLRMSGVLHPSCTGKTVPLHTRCTHVIYQGFMPLGPVFAIHKICHTYPLTRLVLETHVKQYRNAGLSTMYKHKHTHTHNVLAT